MSEFKLPDVGEGLTEAEIVTWKVSVGDQIKVNDIIVDIETAKSIVELPSPYEGRVDALLVDEGQTVDVGTPIIRIISADDPAADAPAPEGAPATLPSAMTAGQFAAAGDLVPDVLTDAPPTAPAAPKAEEKRQSVLVGYGPRATSTKRRARKGAVASVDTDKVPQRSIRALAK